MMLERIYDMVAGAYNGARDGWRGGAPAQKSMAVMQAGYAEKWAIYEGTLFQNAAENNPYKNDPRIYRNIKLLWKHAEAVADFYAGVTYQGDVPTSPPETGNELSGAIPLVAETGDGTRNAQLLRATTELFMAWNWQGQKSLIPLYASVLGDVLTEIVDDRERGFVYPQVVWPGYVTEIELDYVGNVRRYVLEYQVKKKRDNGHVDSFRFRKEVDKEAFRYFRDDAPYDAYGDGPVVPNPYGFVPATWDRHRVGAPGSVRGRAALDGTRQALMQMNSIFAHAFDFQRKNFFVPAMLATGAHPPASGLDVDATDDEEEFDVIPVPPGSQLLQPQFDIGKTLEMLQEIQAGILAENPEAQFYEKLRGMATVATETARLLMGDVQTRVDLARGGYDNQTIKRVQMAIAIAGFRASDGSWNGRDRGENNRLSRRQQAFLPFGLDSYDLGHLDMSMKSRTLVPMTESEHVALVAQKEALMTPWGLGEVNITGDAAKQILDSRTMADVGLM